MVCHHISDDLKEMALSMSLQGLSDSVIHEYTRISEHSLKHLQSSYCATEAVSRKAMDTGRPMCAHCDRSKGASQHDAN